MLTLAWFEFMIYLVWVYDLPPKFMIYSGLSLWSTCWKWFLSARISISKIAFWMVWVYNQPLLPFCRNRCFLKGLGLWSTPFWMVWVYDLPLIFLVILLFLPFSLFFLLFFVFLFRSSPSFGIFPAFSLSFLLCLLSRLFSCCCHLFDFKKLTSFNIAFSHFNK